LVETDDLGRVGVIQRASNNIKSQPQSRGLARLLNVGRTGEALFLNAVYVMLQAVAIEIWVRVGIEQWYQAFQTQNPRQRRTEKKNVGK
jgi:hypothetical protein